MVVGLTGGIGSGKTLVATMFNDIGIPIYVSDIEAKKIMVTDPVVKKAIIKLFGEEAYSITGELNRKLIASQVFLEKSKLDKLNKIVHPAVSKDFNQWYKNQKAHFVIKESAILFETSGDKICDAIILVTAPEDLRIKRVVDRDGITVEEVKNRIRNQWSDSQKVIGSNYVIENLEIEKTKKNVKKVYETILNVLRTC